MNEIAARGKRCSANSKSTGERCQNAAIRGHSVCGVHGVGRPKHTGRPGGRSITNGRYSHRYQSLLSDKKAARFKAAMEDADFLNLVPRIAVLESRFLELLEKLGTPETGETWRRLSELSEEVEATSRGRYKSQKAKNQALTNVWPEIIKLMREGVGEYCAWSEIREIVEDSRKLIETEAKRIKLMAEIVSSEEARIFVARVLEHVQKRIDPKVFTALVYDLEQDLTQTFSKDREE